MLTPFVRDDIVKRAIAGQTSFSGIIYTTTVQWLPNLLPFTANEINHSVYLSSSSCVHSLMVSWYVGQQTSLWMDASLC